jgi:hypothetical protein
MVNNDSWKFRWNWMFDTHPVTYYLGKDHNIVWIQCETVRDEIIWVQTAKSVWGSIWNPAIFALQESIDQPRTSVDEQIADILIELTQTYSYRIGKWLEQPQESVREAA